MALPALVVGSVAVTALNKLMIFASLALVVTFLPALLQFIPGLEFGDGTVSWNILQPLTNALAGAPQEVRYIVWYSYVDYGLFMLISSLIYGLYWDALKAAL